MSEIGCVGKLPFTLMEHVQSNPSFAANYWADAVSIGDAFNAVMSIDSVYLDVGNLDKSIVLAVLHAANDIYAGNGVPKAFSAALQLPPTADGNLFQALNEALLNCASVLDCALGKLHTQRLDKAAATISFVGELHSLLVPISDKGEVWLLDRFYDWSTAVLDFDQMQKLTHLRRVAVCSVPGPKKDVSGDGLAGSLMQLALREQVRITLAVQMLLDLEGHEIKSGDELQRNYLDYAAKLLGMNDYISHKKLLSMMFAPQIFGPLICLVSHPDTMSDLEARKIGEFSVGNPSVELI